jgi:hypothetical protein
MNKDLTILKQIGIGAALIAGVVIYFYALTSGRSNAVVLDEMVHGTDNRSVPERLGHATKHVAKDFIKGFWEK